MLKICLAILLAGLTGTAAAHPGHADGLAAGLAHPFNGLDHLLALLAVGWWSSGLGRNWWQPPLLFAASMLVAAIAAHGLGWVMPGIETLVAVSLLALAALVLRRSLSNPWTAQVLVCVLALVHGAAHGAELSGPALPWLVGMVLATLALHLAGALAGMQLRRFKAARAGDYGLALALGGVGAWSLWSLLA